MKTRPNAAKDSRTVDRAVEFGGVRFVPGHWICRGEDGILVAPHELS